MTTAGQARNFFPAWRIFIFGEEVTEDVVSCTVNYTDGRAPNTAEFTLVNAGITESDDRDADNVSRSAAGLDRYIIDERDIKALYPDVTSSVRLAALKTSIRDIDNLIAVKKDHLSPEALQELTTTEVRRATAEYADNIDQIIRDRLSTTIQDPVKRRVLLDKFREVQVVEQPSFDQVSSGLALRQTQGTIRRLRGEAPRYPFQVGDCIFHTNDPVRIFWRDPQNPNIWYHMFAGFVSDWSEAVTENNEKTVTIRVEDVSRILRYARFVTNPGIFDIKALSTFTDAVSRSFFKGGFQNLTLPEFLFIMIFGSDKVRLDDKTQSGGAKVPPLNTFSYRRPGRGGAKTTVRASGEGVGAFTFERSMTVLVDIPGQDPTLPTVAGLKDRIVEVKDLDKYQAIVDHRVYESDLDNMVALGHEDQLEDIRRELRRLDGRVVSEDVVEAIGRRPDLFPVDGGRLIVLAPRTIGTSLGRNVVLKDIISPALNTTWNTRLALIYDLVARIDFSFYASPRGDLLCEMPLYSFDPEDFGTLVPTTASGIQALLKKSSIKLTFKDDEEHGPYQPLMNIPKRDTISWERSFSDEHVRTMMHGWQQVFGGYVDTGGTYKNFGLPPQVTLLQTLVPQFGVRAEQADPVGLIQSAEGMQLYTAIKLAQINADARSAHVSTLPRIGLAFPNRPIEFAERSFIGTTRSIRHTLVWNNEMTSSLDVNYIRGWSGQTRGDSDDLPLYEPYGGSAANPLDYATLLKPSKVLTNTKSRTTGEPENE